MQEITLIVTDCWMKKECNFVYTFLFCFDERISILFRILTFTSPLYFHVLQRAFGSDELKW